MKITKIIFILLVTVSIFSENKLYSQTAPNVDREFYEAEKLFYQKKYNFAREAFLLYLQRRPLSKNDMLYYYIAACYFQDKKYSEAIDYYKLAFDLNDTYSYCNNIANSYYQLKNYDEALIWYRRSMDRVYLPFTYSFEKVNEQKEIITRNIVTNTFYTMYDFLTLKNEKIAVATNTQVAIESTPQVIEEVLDTALLELNTNTSVPKEINVSPPIVIEKSKYNLVVREFNENEILFTNKVTTNTYTNYITVTNIILKTEINPNVIFQISTESRRDTNANVTITTDLYTNVLVNTNVVSNGVNIQVQTNVAILDNYNTAALYYSSYLHTGHTYLALKEDTNAALYYEIFLKAVGENYYQKESLQKVINIIREPATNIIFMPFNSISRVVTNMDSSITKENISPDSYTRETVFLDNTKTHYTEYKDGKKIYKYTDVFSNSIVETIYPNERKTVSIKKIDDFEKVETFSENGSKTSTLKNSNGDLYEYIIYQDGSSVDRVSFKNGDYKSSIKKADGSIVISEKIKDIVVYNTKDIDGREIIRNEKINGEIITRTIMPDGSIFLKNTIPNGNYTLERTYPNGSVSKTEFVKNEMTDAIEAITTIKYPDGREERRVSSQLEENDNNVQNQFVYKGKTDDGSLITKTFSNDGTSVVDTRKTDGTIIKEAVDTEGIITTDIKERDGTLINRITKLDGATETKTRKRNGDFITEIINSDGSMVVSSAFADGSKSLFTRAFDDTLATESTDSKGNYTQAYSYTDGTSITKMRKINGTTIDIEIKPTEKITRIVNSIGFKVEIKETTDEEGNLKRIIRVENPAAQSVLKEEVDKILKELIPEMNLTYKDVDNVLPDPEE